MQPAADKAKYMSDRASVKDGNGIGNGNWKRNWKLEMVVKKEMIVKIAG